MNRRLLLALVLVLAASPAGAQRPGAGRGMERRLQLEEQVLARFADRAADRLRLDEARREQLRAHVRSTATERRALHRASLELRRRMLQGLNDDAGDAEFERLLGELRGLLDREQALADRELDQLSAFLTPRQRAHYLLLWLRLQENARALLMQRGGGGPGPDL